MPLLTHASTRPRLLRAVAASVAAMLLTACSSAVDELDDAADQPQQGGVLSVGVTNDLVPPSVFTNSSLATNVLVGNVYESLVDYPLESVEPEPALATDWQLADDGRSLTLQLRDDVTFHSGRPMTSKDVEFSIRTWADPVWTVQLQRTAAAITGFDTSQEHEITLEFAHPLSNVFDLLDMMPIIDSETIDQVREGTAFVGTGPFEFESWSPGSDLQLTRYDDYWGEPAYLDGIDLRIIPDPQAQVSQLRAGQLDLVSGASNRDAESLSEDDLFEVQEWKGAEVQVYVGANVDNPALSDVRVRQAIAYALDRDRIVEEVYRGFGVPANLPWPDYSPAYDEEADRTYDYDLERASALIEEVEAENGELPPLPLTYPAEEANTTATAQIVQQDLAEIGLDVELDPTQHAQAIKQLIGAEFEGLWILQHSYAQYTPSTIAVSAYPFNADDNASHYVDRGYQAAANAAWEQTVEAATEPGAYDDLNAALLEGLFLMEIGILHPQTVTRSAVGGVAMTKRSEPLLGRAYLAE